MSKLPRCPECGGELELRCPLCGGRLVQYHGFDGKAMPWLACEQCGEVFTLTWGNEHEVRTER